MNREITFKDILELLVSIAEAGYSEYSQIAKSNYEEELKFLFHDLAEMKMRQREIYSHYLNTLSSFYNAKLQGDYRLYMEGLMYTVNNFLDKADINNREEVFVYAFTIEKNAIILLQELKELMPENEGEKVSKILAETHRSVANLFEIKMLRKAS